MIRECFVYLIEADAVVDQVHRYKRLMKVGISSALKSRVSTISTACPFPVNFIDARRLPSRDGALWVERDIHETCVNFRTHGEWFLADPSSVHLEMDYACSRWFIEKEGMPFDRLPGFLRHAGCREDMIFGIIQAEYGESVALEAAQ